MDERPYIPADVAEAFEQALADYNAWQPGGDEPEVSLNGRSVKISILCGEVMNYSGAMPPLLVELLLRETHAGIEPTDFNPDDSCANGARHLLKLIDFRREDFRRMAERHKS